MVLRVRSAYEVETLLSRTSAVVRSERKVEEIRREVGSQPEPQEQPRVIELTRREPLPLIQGKR